MILPKLPVLQTCLTQSTPSDILLPVNFDSVLIKDILLDWSIMGCGC